ncbi:MAG: hypothetical protein WCA49_23055 [Candidatus Sulfotelmatobacter sp.]
MGIITTSRSELFRQKAADLVRDALGRALEAFRAPAKVREFEYVDQSTNETVYLSTGAQYSVLHVGDKQFYFSRLTGRFDGTCTSLEERVADGLELRD